MNARRDTRSRAIVAAWGETLQLQVSTLACPTHTRRAQATVHFRFLSPAEKTSPSGNVMDAKLKPCLHTRHQLHSTGTEQGVWPARRQQAPVLQLCSCLHSVQAHCPRYDPSLIDRVSLSPMVVTANGMYPTGRVDKITLQSCPRPWTIQRPKPPVARKTLCGCSPTGRNLGTACREETFLGFLPRVNRL